MSESTFSPDDINEKPLLNALEDSVKSRILTVLISEAGEKLNPSRICDRAGIDLETLYVHIDELEASGLVVYTYIVGNGPMYEIDRRNLASAIEALGR
jgi:DNA-binding transcriptional ArsR family regulator